LAGIITHLLIGSEILEKQKFFSQKDSGCFLLGCCFPDAAYWPGENSQHSDLFHYLLAGDIPKILYENTENDSWKAFALGWLCHLHADFALHPLINKYAAQYKYDSKYKDQIVTFEENPQIHAFIENGLDSQMLRMYSIGKLELAYPDFNSEFSFSEVLEKIYPMKFNSKEMKNLLKKFPWRVKLIFGSIKILNNCRIIRSIAIILLSIFGRFLKSSILSIIRSFIKPHKLNDRVISEYQQAIEKLTKNFHLNDIPHWFEQDYNFDTGRISEIGEYDLADKLFTDLDGSENNTRSWRAFRNRFINKENR